MSGVVPNYAGRWDTLNPKLSDFTLRAIESLGFHEMTPVQKGVIPLFLNNKDVVVEAVTGSGKTLAFLVPIIEKLLKLNPGLSGKKVGAIIITPTRELAKQIFQVCTTLLGLGQVAGLDESEDEKSLRRRLQPMLTTGGGGSLSLERELEQIAAYPPRIIIGTPGRLEALLVTRKGLIDTKDIEMLVLDEADRLLEMGFSATINKILLSLPKQRRTGLFSATMTDDLSELIRAGLRNSVKIVVKVSKAASASDQLTEQRIPDSLQIEYIVCEAWQKLEQMLRYIALAPEAKYVVYFATCACVDYFYKVLKLIPALASLDIISLHGQMDIKRRTATYQQFAQLGLAGKGALLVTTDVASRGLDIPDIDGIIHFDLPSDPKAFAHRCGRTARAGRQGHAIFFLSPGVEERYPDFLEIRKIPTSQRAFLASSEVETEDDKAFLKTLRADVAKDRDLVEKGVKAFVSFFRAYSKHQASYIFRVADLDFAAHAWAYLLLRLPRMPELKGKEVIYEDYEIKLDNIPYANKVREAQRQSKIARTIPAPMPKLLPKKNLVDKNTAWSEKVASKDKRERRLLAKKRKAEAKKVAEQEAAVVSQEGSDNDWDELKNEARLIKKLKQGKITQEEVDKELYGDL